MKVKNFAGFMNSKINESKSTDEMNKYCQKHFGKDYDKCSAAQQAKCKKALKMNEADEYEAGIYGANPEEEMAAELEGMEGEEDLEGMEGEEGEEDEEVTLEDLKAMVEELTERVEALEGGEDEEGEEDLEGEEGEEGEEDLEGEEGEEEEEV